MEIYHSGDVDVDTCLDINASLEEENKAIKGLIEIVSKKHVIHFSERREEPKETIKRKLETFLREEIGKVRDKMFENA